jgi:hypothetical protein
MNGPEDDSINELTADQTADPRIEYTRRRASRHADAARHIQRFRKIRILCLSTLTTGLALVRLAFNGQVSWW